jgi:RND family efflux transporter MFP subunit
MPDEEHAAAVVTPTTHPPPPQTPPPAAGWGPGRLLAAAVLFAALVGGGLAAGLVPRLERNRAVRERAEAAAARPPRVAVAVAARIAPDAVRVLPGSSLAWRDVSLNSRATGYVKWWKADIGDRVKKGQVLAEIAAPDLDAQLEQARATLTQDKANLLRAKAQEVYARAEEKRQEDTYKSGGGSKNDYESALAASRVAAATVSAGEATLKVDEANIMRLDALQSFQKITAPFDGVITARLVDPGALILADSPGATSELFHLMETDTLRVWVGVPQTFSTTVKAGQPVTVYRREDPTRTHAGVVARTRGALDPSTRTLLTEVHVPNKDNALDVGMYLQVKFNFDRSIFPVMIPSAAVVVRTQAPTVAVLDATHAVHYRPVQLGRDYGATVEVLGGLEPGETVAVHPGDDLPDGTVVEPVAPAK